MIMGIGTDLVEIDRMEGALGRHQDRLRERMFTSAEQAYCEKFRRPAVQFAARLAAKEAFSKAVGVGIGKEISWTDVEVAHDDKGAPRLHLSEKAQKFVAECGADRSHITISHSKSHAIAVVIVEKMKEI